MLSMRQRAARLKHDTRGSVAVTFALLMVILCMFVGAAVDLGRWSHARNVTISALDAAVLAGGAVIQSADNPASVLALAHETAIRYYRENTQSRPPVIDDTVAFIASNDFTSYAATGNAYIETTFLKFAQIAKLPLLDVSEATYSKAQLAGGANATKIPIEIAMMLDVTGSMAGSKITDLKAAATDLVTIVMSESINARPVRIGLVPFAEGVRLPASLNSQVRGTPGPAFTRNAYGQTWHYDKTECVVERTGTEKYTDAAPGPGKYTMTLFNTTIAIYTKGKCNLSANDEVLPLSNDKDLLKTRIQGLGLSGGTAGHLGTAWAWYLLSPNWNVLWPAANQAKDYGASAEKIAILMTDGEYNIGYDAYGLQHDMPGAGAAVNGNSPTQALALCTNMKAKGITVYTVGFALGGNQTAINTLRSCATSASTTYTAENGTELKQAFRDIARKISPLYLSQ
jgi:Flp pilus assembly protein TadG